MRAALKQKYGAYDSRDQGLDYDRMKPNEIVAAYESWMTGADDYYSNERR